MPLSGKTQCVTAKIHRTIRWASRAHANGRQRNQRAARGLCQWSPGRTGLSGVPRASLLQRLALPEKEGNCACSLSGGAPDCPMRPRTEGNYDLPNGATTAPRCLGAIKGTPRCMEQNTKHLLNILRCWYFAFTHLVHCDRDSSTFLSCNSTVLLSCARSCLVCVLVLQLSLLCVLFFLPYSRTHSRSFYVRRERLQSVEIPHKGIYLR
jgi:hypothetical protein